MSHERLQILAKPAWQPLQGHPVVKNLDLPVLRAMDSFFAHMHRFAISAPTKDDFLAWASLAGGSAVLAHLSAGLAQFDPADPSLGMVETARALLASKEGHEAMPARGRRAYSRSVSVPFEELPAEWQSFLSGLKARRIGGDPSAPAPNVQDRMAQKLGQYLFVLRQAGLAEDLHQQGLTAFYADVSTRISGRSQATLRPATLRATWEELERFARLRGTYSIELMTGLRKTLGTLREEEESVTQLKYTRMHGLGGPPELIRQAFALLATAGDSHSPIRRHALRNRAAALGLPAILPLRRDWDRLVFGKTLVWERDRYRFRNFKPGKTALLDGRRTFPASIPPRMACFIDALILQDNDPKYLGALRRQVEETQRPLFVHAAGTPAAKSYVSRVWSELAGTGATIARTMMHDQFGARGEAGLMKAMILCDQYAPDTADHYRGVAVHQRLFEAAQDDLVDEFEDLLKKG